MSFMRPKFHSRKECLVNLVQKDQLVVEVRLDQWVQWETTVSVVVLVFRVILVNLVRWANKEKKVLKVNSVLLVMRVNKALVEISVITVTRAFKERLVRQENVVLMGFVVLKDLLADLVRAVVPVVLVCPVCQESRVYLVHPVKWDPKVTAASTEHADLLVKTDDQVKMDRRVTLVSLEIVAKKENKVLRVRPEEMVTTVNLVQVVNVVLMAFQVHPVCVVIQVMMDLVVKIPLVTKVFKGIKVNVVFLVHLVFLAKMLLMTKESVE